MAWGNFKDRIKKGDPNKNEVTINDRNIALAKTRGEETRKTAREANEFNSRNMTALAKTRGEETRKTAREANEFNSRNMTAQQKADVKLRKRKMSLVDQVEKERNRLFGERTQAVADAAWGKTATDRATLQNEIYQQDFFEREDGTTGRHSETPHPGKILFNQMEKAKDKTAFFKGLSTEQQQNIQGYRGLQNRMASAMGALPVRPTQAQSVINTQGWSANRLKRTMGEVGGSRNLDIGGGAQIPTRFNQVSAGGTNQYGVPPGQDYASWRKGVRGSMDGGGVFTDAAARTANTASAGLSPIPEGGPIQENFIAAPEGGPVRNQVFPSLQTRAQVPGRFSSASVLNKYPAVNYPGARVSGGPSTPRSQFTAFTPEQRLNQSAWQRANRSLQAPAASLSYKPKPTPTLTTAQKNKAAEEAKKKLRRRTHT